MKETPVLLLTGYLGSGKTTLLNRILSNEKGIKFAVIVNDIGEVNIDATLIQQGGVVNQQDDSLVALQNGCICCTLKMDLVKQLQDIIQMQRFDYIVIEASGICEPGPIAQTICSIPSMDPELTKDGYPRLDCIVTVVDALRMRDEFEGGALLTRPDIDEINNNSTVIVYNTDYGYRILHTDLNNTKQYTLGDTYFFDDDVEICEDFDKILNTNMFDFDKVATSAAWIQEVERHHEEDEDDDDDDDDDEHDHEHHHDHHDEHDEHDEHEHHHHHHHHHHHDEGEAEEYGIGTFVYYRRGPFKLGLFDDFVARKWPKGVIRAKGICYFNDELDMCYLFEQAGKQVSIRQAGQWFATMPKDELAQMMERDAALRADWDEQYGDRMQKIVFIGQHLDKEAITKALDECLA